MDVVKDAVEDPGATGGPAVGGLPSAEELAGLNGPELERVLADVERLRRRVESVLAIGVAPGRRVGSVSRRRSPDGAGVGAGSIERVADDRVADLA
jgi:hypothetical protein